MHLDEDNLRFFNFHIFKTVSINPISVTGRAVGLDQHLAEFLDGLGATHLLRQQRHAHNMEILVQNINLLQVFLLHLVSHTTMLAIGA